MKSPTWNGLSQKMRNPAIVFAMESWAANPTAIPATPSPASIAPTLIPNWLAAITMPKTQIVNL
jgi:hypothetical protein